MRKITLYFILICVLCLFITSCDSRVGKPDIRDEYNQDLTLDYFGWRFDFKY